MLVGGTATLVDYSVFWLLDGVLLPLIGSSKGWAIASLIIATALGFCVGLVVNWLLSVRFVFLQVKDKEEARSKKSFMIFTIIGVIGLLITEIGVILLVTILPEFSLFGSVTFLGTTWAKWLSRVVMTCIVLMWNYVGRKIFVFKS